MDNEEFIYKFLDRSLKRGSYAGLRLSTNSKRTILYSYATAIAEFIHDKNDNTCLLVSNDTFSVTTARHLHIINKNLNYYLFNEFDHIKVLHMPQSYGNDNFTDYFIKNLKREENYIKWVIENKLYTKESYRIHSIEFYKQLQKLSVIEYCDGQWNKTINDMLINMQSIMQPIFIKQINLLIKRIKTNRYDDYYSQELNKKLTDLQGLRFVA